MLFLRIALSLLIAAWPPAGAAAPDLPAIMIFTGRLVADGAIKPTPGDAVLVFNMSDGQLAGTGILGGGGGSFQAVVSRTRSFNGTPVVLEFQQGLRRYALQREDGSPAWLPFAGRLLPERTVLNLRIGAKTAELKADEAARPEAQRLSRRTDLPCLAVADVNEDGRCDEADRAILRLYGGGVSQTVGRR